MSGVPPPNQIYPPSAPPAPLPFPILGQLGQLVVGYGPLGEPILAPGSPGRPILARQFAGDFNFLSYLYSHYFDDDDLQALVTSFNNLAQQYLNWFNEVQLPYYPGPLVADGLLDWVAQGLYGMMRPLLPEGTVRVEGPLGTFALGEIPLGVAVFIGNLVYYSVDDDYFKRILTWHLYKGDGKYWTTEWLKRRVLRFLSGTNGTPGNVIDQLYQVSVTFGAGNTAVISLLLGKRTITAGPLGTYALGELALGEGITTTQHYPPFPGSPLIFQAAVERGVLELPFQYTWSVQIVNPT
jgi:hypothetical protein